jgi:tRNA uridine 5-carboxymethylaminomethyl modification enzyme
MFTSRAEYRILLRQDDADMRLTPRAYAIGLADQHRYDVMEEKRKWRDAIIQLARTASVSADTVNPLLEAEGSSLAQQGAKLVNFITRPELTIMKLASVVQPLAELIEQIPADRRTEIVEAAEILIKYEGYIERERMNAAKLHRLEDVKIPEAIDYKEIKALSTEARQKLDARRPQTIGQASRIPGISPSDVNILLLMMKR